MADVFEEEPQQTVSLNEYLEEVEDQELEVDLVLGGDEGKECTYSKGYMKRQATFSCLTCTPNGNAGVCTACSLSCHDGHEIIELWTKRNFRCDCGNSKFGEFFCKLFPNKDIENAENSYNHNFKGQYCACGRPYPDPDIQEQVEMIQCCICEDWFHEEHLGHESSDEVPRDEEGEPLYEDFICHLCSAICSFLSLYPQTIWAALKLPNAASTSKEKEVEIAPSASGSSGKLENGSCSLESLNVDPTTTDCNSENVDAEKSALLGQNAETYMKLRECSQVAGRRTTCLLGVDLFSALSSSEKNKAMFLSKNWREVLCRCAKCADFYAHKGVGFLLDREDSIAEYEKMGKQKRDEKLQQQEGAELNFLSKLGHVEKMEILSGIADMKDEIRTFLETFDTSKPITSDDIRLVFDNLSKKRRRMD